MNWVDLLIVVVVAGGVVSGLSRGLVRQIFSLAGLIGGLLLAQRGYSTLAPALSFLPDERLANVLAFAAILIGVIVAANLVASLIKALLGVTPLGCVDHLLGGLLGAAESALFVSIIVILLDKFPVFGVAELLKSSALAPLILAYIPQLLGLFPHQG